MSVCLAQITNLMATEAPGNLKPVKGDTHNKFIINGSTKRVLKQAPAARFQDAPRQTNQRRASTLQAHVCFTLPHGSSHSGSSGLLPGIISSCDFLQDNVCGTQHF